MYAGTVFLGGKYGELGADAVFEEVTPADRDLVAAALERWTSPRAGGRLSQTGRRPSDSGTSSRARETSGNLPYDQVVSETTPQNESGQGRLIDSDTDRT